MPDEAKTSVECALEMSVRGGNMDAVVVWHNGVIAYAAIYAKEKGLALYKVDSEITEHSLDEY